MKCFTIILFLMMFQNCYFQLNSCESVRKGEFTLIEEFAGNTYIVRRKNIQIEHGSKSKIKLKLKIAWNDSYTYSLELIKILRNPNIIPVPEKLQLIIKDTEVNNYYYKCFITDVTANQSLERKIYFSKN